MSLRMAKRSEYSGITEDLALFWQLGHNVEIVLAYPETDWEYPKIEFGYPGIDWEYPKIDFGCPGIDWECPKIEFGCPGIDWEYLELVGMHRKRECPQAKEVAQLSNMVEEAAK
jgi:hypothetical protein